jgi:hypothetical protein
MKPKDEDIESAQLKAPASIFNQGNVYIRGRRRVKPQRPPVSPVDVTKFRLDAFWRESPDYISGHMDYLAEVYDRLGLKFAD